MDNVVAGAEDRLWDYYGREKHHWPDIDITCEGPHGERVSEDVVLRLGRVATLLEKKDASNVETEGGESFKRGYTEAMARQEGDMFILVELARGRARLIRAQMRTVENGEADDQVTTQEFDPAVGAGPPTEINAGKDAF